MIKSAIDGVVLHDLQIIPTDGGDVLHMLRADAAFFTGFGEVYFSEVLPLHVKAWKCHKKQTQRFAVPAGRLQIVLYDDRQNSPSQGKLEIYELGRPDAYKLLCIPPMIWYGFTALGNAPAIICNCTDMPHDPQEALRMDQHSSAIPYRWHNTKDSL